MVQRDSECAGLLGMDQAETCPGLTHGSSLSTQAPLLPSPQPLPWGVKVKTLKTFS